MRFSIFLFFFYSYYSSAQLFFDQGNKVQVTVNGSILPMPWVGGLNTPQFSEVDINDDGYTDVVCYDRDAEVFVPFIHNPHVNTGEYGYDYFPKYNSILPISQHWALFRDLNNDGKKDLLTSSSGGAHYYKNTSTPYNTSFEFVETLESKRGASYTKIFVDNADIPIIEDIDFDGDLDIVTFGVTGKFVELNENISTTPGVYDFKVTDKCWGDFSESFFTNDVMLEDPECLTQIQDQKLMEPLHTGSTLAVYDLDNDNDMEVFIGDVSFNNIVQLSNTPTDGEDRMTSKIMNYPTSDPIDMSVFPAVYFIDFDRDGSRDMLVSPNSGNSSLSKNNVWLYKNTGSNTNPNFVFNKQTAFVDQMIDLGRYSKVSIFDYNQDNLMDIVVSGGQTVTPAGLQSNVSLYKNTGTQSDPKFSLITDNFAGINSLNLGTHVSPCFADLDNDGKEDMILGKSDGTLLYFKNNSNTSVPWNFSLNTSILSGIDVGNNSTPALYDINQDGLTDLLIGNREGKITYYKNTGTATSPSFSLVTDFLGNVHIFSPTSQGFLDFDVINDDGNIVIYAGSSASGINRIENIDGNLTGTFTISDSNVHNLSNLKHSSPALYDFNNDGYLDMLVGGIRGGVEYFHGIDEQWVSIPEYPKGDISLYPNPAQNNLHISSPVEWISYSISNIQGAIIQQGNFENTIDISILKHGIYVIQVKNGTTYETVKFIKQ